MRVPCSLRTIRGQRTLSEIARASGVQVPHLSQIERGHMLPKDAWLDELERAYGAPLEQWYPPRVLAAFVIGEDER